jgi:predicted RecB family nuclease
MRFRASDVYDYYRPSKCGLRVALRHRGEPEDEGAETPFDRILQELGLRHERGHLATLPGVLDLSHVEDKQEQERQTLAGIRFGVPAIYQARLRAELEIDGMPCELVGEPDFLVRASDGSGYVIRDSKLARRVLSRDHAAIPMQLRIYGLLYERTVGQRPAALEVHAGTGEIIAVPYEGETPILESLAAQLRMRTAPIDAYEPVGITKCGDCGFHARCWGQAEASNDVSLLAPVKQELARKLRARGIATIRDIPGAIENPANRDLFYKGVRKPRLQDFVEGLRRSAEAYASCKPILIAAPDLPVTKNLAMFDLEGLPPYLDDIEKVYLWGVKVFGDKPSGFLPAQAGFGPDGDRVGWFAFLDLARRLLAEHDDLRFVHWSNYERSKLTLYAERYGDPDGTAARVLDRLVDLLDVVRKSVVLPLPSYGLKVIEKYVGFERKLPESGGAWAIAKYIEATETNDPAAREEILGEILAYNEEDLDATWAVMEWVSALTDSS